MKKDWGEARREMRLNAERIKQVLSESETAREAFEALSAEGTITMNIRTFYKRISRLQEGEKDENI